MKAKDVSAHSSNNFSVVENVVTTTSFLPLIRYDFNCLDSVSSSRRTATYKKSDDDDASFSFIVFVRLDLRPVEPDEENEREKERKREKEGTQASKQMKVASSVSALLLPNHLVEH